MSDGERVETMISDWLERNYPESFETWYDRGKQQKLAIEIRMIPAFGAIEYNICNGGWAQFLWNCFERRAGYSLRSVRARRKGMCRDHREVDERPVGSLGVVFLRVHAAERRSV